MGMARSMWSPLVSSVSGSSGYPFTKHWYIHTSIYVYELRAISQANVGLDADRRDVTAGCTYKARSSVTVTIYIEL